MTVRNLLRRTMGSRDRRQAWRALLATIAAAGLAGGCAASAPDRAERMARGYVYYLDGAGGGGVTNWSGGVRQGLLEAGYDGAGEMFSWETGLGVVADQNAGNAYKRGKAEKLAEKIIAYRKAHPDAPITLIGLSAGTVIAVFTLESLPADLMIENVILLSGSLSAPYDLSKALRHVRGKVYVTTSHRDPVLGALLPITGTADRGAGTTATIGIEGPELPPGASAETRRLYSAKVVVIPWKEEFARYGNRGGHTDTVAAPFVARYVAPLVKTNSGAQFAARATTAAGLVRNPDYERWARFEPGSFVVFEGRQTVDGVRQPLRVKVTLVSKSAQQLVFQREPLGEPDETQQQLFAQTVYASAQIDPAESPLTHPAAVVRDLPGARVRVGPRELACKVRSVSAPAEFEAWGSHPEATIYINEEVPSGLVQLDIQTRLGQRQVAVSGKLVEFNVAGKPGVAAAR